MKPDILLLDRFSESGEAQLDAVYRVHRFYAGSVALDDIAQTVRAIVTSGAKGAPNAVIDKLTPWRSLQSAAWGPTLSISIERAGVRSMSRRLQTY